ncbi:DUF5977 domain-containing protein [Empedobacter brevis]
MKKLLSCLIVFFINSFILFSQNLNQSVDNFSLIKNVNSSIDLSKGKSTLDIPLFNVPFLSSSISYRSDLNVYSKESGITGQNMNLNIWGKIVIQYDYLHDLVGSNVISSNYLGTSSLDSIRYKTYNQTFYKNNSSNNDKFKYYKNPLLLSSDKENASYSFQPEKYYFNFLGKSGYFTFDNDGNILINSENDILKVEMPTYSQNFYSSIQPQEIVIKDLEGNKYFFGGSYDAVDINYTKNDYSYDDTLNCVFNCGSSNYTCQDNCYKNERFSNSTRRNYITSFYLTRVELSNGLKMQAYFKKSDLYLDKNFTYKTNIMKDNVLVMPSNDELYRKNIFLGYEERQSYPSKALNDLTIYDKVSLLDRIEISDGTNINFEYNLLNNPYNTQKYYKPNLIKIEVLNNHKVKTNEIIFDYIFFKNSHKNYLKKIKINDAEYSFDYYDKFIKNGDDINTPYDKEAGLVKKYYSPLNGSEEFIYEQNEISSLRYYNIYSENYEMINGENKKTQGFRILKRIKFDNVKYDTISYYYNNNDGKSSGHLSNSYYNLYNSTNTNTEIKTKFFVNTKFSNSTDMFVEYSKVTEKSKNGKIEYYFTDYKSNPDSISSYFYQGSSQGVVRKIDARILVSKENERNKISKKIIYDKNNKEVQKILYSYSNFQKNIHPLNNYVNCTTCRIGDYNYYMKSSGLKFTNRNGAYTQVINYFTIGYQPVLPYLLSKVVTTDYLDNGKSITTEKKLTYNEALSYWHPLPIKEETTSNGSTITDEILYNYDLLRKTNCGTNCTDNISVGGKLGTYKAMADNNVLAPVVSISTNQNNKKSLTENIYSKNTLNQNQFNVTSNKVSLLNSSIDQNNLSSVVTTTVKENQLFDDKGNLLQFSEKGGLPTTIIYGYNQSLPIAEIKGATYGQVMTAFGLAQDAKAYLNLDIVKKSNLDKDDATEATLISAMNAFKNNTKLNDFLVVTKTYNPLIGISSESTPTGQRTYYQYDENNQLVKILDHQKNILQEFKYNYAKRKYYNEALTINLYKNDCSEGLFTNPIIHVIPSNKYVSYISINDANEIAKKEEEKLNQDYANKNGTCIPFTCKFNQGDFVYDFDHSIEKTSIMNEVKLQIGFILTLTDLKNYNWSKEVKIGRLTGSCVPLKNQYFKFNFGETLIIGYIENGGNIIINSIKLRAENFYPLDIKYNR